MPKTVQDQAASSTRTTVCSIHKMMFMLMMRRSRTRRRQARRSSKLDFEHPPATPTQTLTLGCLNQALTKPLAACLRLLRFGRYVSQIHTTHGYFHGILRASNGSARCSQFRLLFEAITQRNISCFEYNFSLDSKSSGDVRLSMPETIWSSLLLLSQIPSTTDPLGLQSQLHD